MKRGFTLIEVLVCVVIVALLATIALPSWRAVVTRSQRGDATAALYALATAQERYRMVHGVYAAAAAPAPPVGLGFASSERGWYELRIEYADATRFTATARPRDGAPPASDADCRLFTIDQTGVRGSVPEGPDTCWR